MLKICPCFWVGAGRMGKKEFSVIFSCVFFMRCIWRFQLIFNMIFLITESTTVLAWIKRCVSLQMDNKPLPSWIWGSCWSAMEYGSTNKHIWTIPCVSRRKSISNCFCFSNSVRGGDFLLVFPKKEHLLEELFRTPYKTSTFPCFPQRFWVSVKLVLTLGSEVILSFPCRWQLKLFWNFYPEPRGNDLNLTCA